MGKGKKKVKLRSVVKKAITQSASVKKVIQKKSNRPSAFSPSTSTTPVTIFTRQPPSTESDSKSQPQPETSKLSLLQRQLRSKLQGATFRQLNESLYTQTGTESKQQLQKNPNLFQEYHIGYTHQVQRWPCNPLDDVLCHMRTLKHSIRIADLGCGEARLSKDAPQKIIHSFDLIAANDRVVACDIANVPLGDSCIDVTVFCLSLMGTNYPDFVKEAWRILIPGGLLLIAEVASRFGDDKCMEMFVKGIERIGFEFDNQHPFVSGGSVGENGDGGKKKNKKKNKWNKRKGEGDDDDGKQTGSAFFHKFAFRCTKKTESERLPSDGGKNRKSMDLPSLGACVYKKR